MVKCADSGGFDVIVTGFWGEWLSYRLKFGADSLYKFGPDSVAHFPDVLCP